MYTMIHVIVLLALLTGQMQKVVTPQPPPEKAHAPDVVFVGTPNDAVMSMLNMAGMKKDDIIYDLGCGDGRVLVLAAQKYGCRGKGYDIDPERVTVARENVKRSGVETLVRIMQEDIFTLDFRDADVVSLYLLPELNLKLVPQLQKLKPGSRIVTHDYGLEGFIPDKVVSGRSNEDNALYSLYLYITPLKSAK
jgi:SAM-dependent methyltransferase